MDEFRIRQAREGDADAIRELVVSGGINPAGVDWRNFVVAETRNGVVVGCGQVRPHYSDLLELASIAVQPQFRRRGIARSIVGILLDRGPRPIYLTCRSGLEDMYRRFGFVAVGLEQAPRFFRRFARILAVHDQLSISGERLVVMKLE